MEPGEIYIADFPRPGPSVIVVSEGTGWRIS